MSNCGQRCGHSWTEGGLWQEAATWACAPRRGSVSRSGAVFSRHLRPDFASDWAFGPQQQIETPAVTRYHCAMSHDFAFQRRETFDTFRESKGVKLPARAVVDFAFFAEIDDADWPGITRALEARGYRISRPDEDETLIASVGPIQISAEEIWKWEEIATQIAVGFEFYPDGWELDI